MYLMTELWLMPVGLLTQIHSTAGLYQSYLLLQGYTCFIVYEAQPLDCMAPFAFNGYARPYAVDTLPRLWQQPVWFDVI